MRIGLIAMSGVRACDPELLQLGLTLPGFVERSKTIASLPSLGLLTLAGATPPEHECEYLEIDDIRKLGDLPGGFDLVAISSFSAQINEGYELADRYRELGVKVVLGGLHVTALPQEAAQHADAVVVGEGEAVWRELLRDAENGRLQRFYRGDGRFDLAKGPMPAFHLLDISKYNRLTVQASRGCPFRCEFCASSILLTRQYKQKPVERVLAEIDRIREIWRRPFLEFADDNAFVNRSYWKRLLPQLAGRRVRWFAETDLSVHQDDELLRMARDAGCAEVLIGLESPVEAGLAGLEMKVDWKRERWPDYKAAIRRIQSHGIRVNGCFVLGLDEHTPRIFDDLLDFVVDTELFDVQITYLTPFPGTPLYDRLKRQGRLLYDDQWQRCTLFDVNYVPMRMSPEELRHGFHRLASTLYGDELSKWRRETFARVSAVEVINVGSCVMKSPVWIPILFVLVALYDGLLGLVFLLAPQWPFNQFKVTPPNHFGYVQFPAALLVVFALMFLQIAASPVRRRDLIPYGIMLKLAFVVISGCYWCMSGIPGMWKPFTVIDAMTAVLFVVAYASLGVRRRVESHG